jgi:SAM-dependent methyltransferase
MDNKPNSLSGTFACWDDLAAKNENKPHIDSILGRYKSREFISIVDRWISDFENKKVLKTDLREEAYGDDEVLFSLSSSKSFFFALDISHETVVRAYIRQASQGLFHKYITADVLAIPFGNDTFDIVLSTSTLDHFQSQEDFAKSLSELYRVMKPHATMIITINNRCNLNFCLFLILEKIFNLKSYPVQAYTPARLKQIIRKTGFNIQEEDFNTHVISPMNTMLLILRRFMHKETVDKIAERFVSLSEWIGQRKRLKIFTGWFTALKCVK